MALVSMRQMLDHAAENGYGIPAFNVNNLEQVRAIMIAADKTNSPVILQGSAGARKYAGAPFLRHLILAAIEEFPHIPVVMHQDHGTSPSVCQRSIQLGFSSVMMDGSLMEDGKTPSSYEYNVDVTKQVVDLAHAQGVSVEGELGCLGSLETGMGDQEDGHGAEGKLDLDMLLTDPEEAATFVKETGVDDVGLLEFYEKYFKFPLYKDDELQIYKAQGNRKIKFIPYNLTDRIKLRTIDYFRMSHIGDN